MARASGRRNTRHRRAKAAASSRPRPTSRRLAMIAVAPDPVRNVARTAWRVARSPGWEGYDGERGIPEETAIALTFNRITHAVMMATPGDLEDFAVGFSLTEGIVENPSEIETLDVVPTDMGVELRMWIAEPRSDAFTARRRHVAGP